MCLSSLAVPHAAKIQIEQNRRREKSGELVLRLQCDKMHLKKALNGLARDIFVNSIYDPKGWVTIVALGLFRQLLDAILDKLIYITEN